MNSNVISSKQFITEWRERAGIEMVNYELNKDDLKDAIYLKVLDLAAVVVFDVTLEHDGDGFHMVWADRTLIDLMGIPESAVIAIAVHNMTRKTIGRLKPHDEDSTIGRIAAYTYMDYPYGASIILRNSILRAISKEMSDDGTPQKFYIMLNSTDAVIVAPTNVSKGILERVACTLSKDKERVSEDDYLSSNVYTYIPEMDRVILD